MAEFTEEVDTVSTLEASNLVELAAQSGGRILELKIRQGDEVEPGQLLVVLDQAQLQALGRVQGSGQLRLPECLLRCEFCAKYQLDSWIR